MDIYIRVLVPNASAISAEYNLQISNGTCLLGVQHHDAKRSPCSAYSSTTIAYI